MTAPGSTGSQMRIVLRPFPVLYACQGCPEYGQGARDLAQRLDRAGVGELIWLGSAADIQPTERYPVLAIDGCKKGCALKWLADHGVAAEGGYVVT
ncbi:MAG TPA: putative zinc-binding protein [Burkholderiales bacterium]|nr:putative zinc-binding protein [Burkholderiales bacterium]